LLSGVLLGDVGYVTIGGSWGVPLAESLGDFTDTGVFGRSIEGDGALGSFDTNICEAHGVPFIAGLLLSDRFIVTFFGDDVDPTGVLWLREVYLSVGICVFRNPRWP
jgi:hypothetical protein